MVLNGSNANVRSANHYRMIEKIYWPQGENNPFIKGPNQRPLRITLHTQTLQNLSGQEAEALDAIKELSKLPDVEVWQTEKGEFTDLQIETFDGGQDVTPVFVERPNGSQTWTGVSFTHQYKELAASLLGKAYEDPEAEPFFNELILAQAHRVLNR